MDLLPPRLSELSEAFGDCENPSNVGKSQDSSLPVAVHFGVFAGFEMATDGVGVDAEERAQVCCPLAVLLGDSKSVTLGRWVVCIWLFEGYSNFP